MTEETERETPSKPERVEPIKLIDLGESVIELENIACVDKVYTHYKQHGRYFLWQTRKLFHGIRVYYTQTSKARFNNNDIPFNSEAERDRQYNRLVKALAEIRSIVTEDAN